MKIYFLSSKPCVLTVNGAFFGTVNGFERFAEINLKDNLFLSFTPENALPVGFFLTENIRFSPPKHVDVYLLPDALALYVRDFPSADFSLNLIAQERFDDVLASVFSQAGVHFGLQTQEGAFNAPLPPSFCQCTLSKIEDFILLRSPTQLAVFSLHGKQILLQDASEYFIDGDELTVQVPLFDSLGRSATRKWQLSENGATLLSYTLRQARTGASVQADTNANTAASTEVVTDTQTGANGQTDELLRNELLPFAFFESVLYGGDFQAFLDDELLETADKIKDFLGDFRSVVLTKNTNTCGLVYVKGEHLFEVKHASVELKDGKITEIKM